MKNMSKSELLEIARETNLVIEAQGITSRLWAYYFTPIDTKEILCKEDIVCDEQEPLELSPVNISISDDLSIVLAKQLSESSSDGVLILNPGSARHPCGRYNSGDIGYEEVLSYTTNLKNSLKQCNSIYKAHRADSNNGLYSDCMIYSSNICIFRDGSLKIAPPFTCDVITAFPIRYDIAIQSGISNLELRATLEERLDNILLLAKSRKIKNLILSPFGTGRFKNDPHNVALAFRQAIFSKEFVNFFKNIIFSIPFSDLEFTAFTQVFKNY